MKRFSLLASALACLAISLCSTAMAGEQLTTAISLLSPTGEYLPLVSWGVEAGSPAGGLVVAEPAAVTFFRRALLDDPSLEASTDPNVTRLKYLRYAWKVTAGDPVFLAALDGLSTRTAEAEAAGWDGRQIVHQILQVDPALQEAIRIREIPGRGAGQARRGTEAPAQLEALKCYDTNYYISNLWPTLICLQNGSNCTVEVPCPKPKDD